jgi:diguanylate cyclase
MTDAARLPDQKQTLRRLLARGHLRLILLAVCLAATSLMASGLFVIRNYAAENVSLSASTLAYSVEPALVFEDREAALDLINGLGSSRNLASIVVRDAQGQPFAEWEQQGSDLGGVAQWLAASVWLSPDTREIEFQGRVIGSVTVTGSFAAVLGYLFAALAIALACLLITVLATFMLARRLEESIAGPLERVAQISNELRYDRCLSQRLDGGGIAEIDRFADDFNALLDELEQWNSSLADENAELLRRADRDPLTGLGNRARFEKVLESAIKVSQLTQRQVALLYLDCNLFKEINDTFGHDVGDAVLCTIAQRLRLVVQDDGRVKDRVFRLGGDEFAIVLDNITSSEPIAELLDRLATVMEEPVQVALREERRIAVTAGVAICPEDGDTPRQLVRVADQRMYANKKGRRTDEFDDC